VRLKEAYAVLNNLLSLLTNMASNDEMFSSVDRNIHGMCALIN
jgi:hypothetical protein